MCMIKSSELKIKRKNSHHLFISHFPVSSNHIFPSALESFIISRTSLAINEDNCWYGMTSHLYSWNIEIVSLRRWIKAGEFLCEAWNSPLIISRPVNWRGGSCFWWTRIWRESISQCYIFNQITTRHLEAYPIFQLFWKSNISVKMSPSIHLV